MRELSSVDADLLTMPSRKRNKGKARKAKAAGGGGGPGDDLRLQQRVVGCCQHGLPPPPRTNEDLCSLLLKFCDAWDDAARSSNPFAVAAGAASATHKGQRGVWDEDGSREFAESVLVSFGAKSILEGNYDCAAAYAGAVLLLENYDPTQHVGASYDAPPVSIGRTDEEYWKHRDLINGRERSLLQFFSRRVSCTCLDEKYAEAEGRPKV